MKILSLVMIIESLSLTLVPQHLIHTQIFLHLIMFYMHLISKGTLFLFFNSVSNITLLLSFFSDSFLIKNMSTRISLFRD